MDQFRDKARLAGEVDNVSEGSGGSQDFGQNYFYDSKRGELLGRTIQSWLKLLMFYFLFTTL